MNLLECSTTLSSSSSSQVTRVTLPAASTPHTHRQTMTSLAVCLLPAVLLAILQVATPARDSAHIATGHASRHTPLGLLLRKRSLESALRGPPTSSLFSDSLIERMPTNKRGDEGYWIWMPAHGYMPIPREELAEQQGGQDSMGNLLRYG